MGKIGIHLSSYTPSWDDNVIPFIGISADIGYEAVEFPLMSPDTFDYQSAAAELKRYGLSCTCGTSVNPLEDPSSTDEEVREAGIARLKKCVDICSYLEADCLGGVLYAPWGQHLHRADTHENKKHAISSIQRVSEYAKEKGIMLSLEILNRYESYFMNTMEEGIAFIHQVNRENVKLHFDTFHAHIEEKSIRTAIMQGKGYIGHVHLCDNNRAAPGSGAIDFMAVKDSLERIGYDRYLMVENFVIPDSDAGKEVCIWRRSAVSSLENARQAFEYVSRCF